MAAFDGKSKSREWVKGTTTGDLERIGEALMERVPDDWAMRHWNLSLLKEVEEELYRRSKNE